MCVSVKEYIKTSTYYKKYKNGDIKYFSNFERISHNFNISIFY